MDKLQPLITHRFWILTGLAVVLGLVGYWMGTSALAEEIDARTAKVAALKPSAGAAQPNQTWIDQAAEIAGARKETLQEVAERLAGTQEGLRVWPEGYRPYVEGLDYFGQIDLTGREAYRDYYPGEVESVRAVVRPYEDETKTGVVAMRPGVAPSFSTADWPRLPPESNTIWAAQEDVWLLRELLARATVVNEGADSILDAPLKEIQSLLLQGGGEAAAAESGSAVSDDGGESRGPSESSSSLGIEMDLGGGSARGGRAGGPAVDFDLSEEVGPAEGVDDDPTLAPGGGAAGAADAAAGSGSEYAEESTGESDRGPSGMGMFRGAGGRGEAPGAVTPGGGRRYIASAPELPYRTRAFQMTVVVDHRELPALLMSLTNSAWPVEIVRVHSSDAIAPAGHAAVTAAGGRGGFGRGGFGEGESSDEGRDPFGRGGTGGFGGLGGGKYGDFEESGDSGSSRAPGGRGPAGRDRNAAPPPDPSDPYQVALAQPYLVTAAIGGVMTIYKPLTEDEAPEAVDGEPADPDGPGADGEEVSGAASAGPAGVSAADPTGGAGPDLPPDSPATGPDGPAPAAPDPTGDGGPQRAAGASSEPAAADAPPGEAPPADGLPTDNVPADDPTDLGDLPL